MKDFAVCVDGPVAGSELPVSRFPIMIRVAFGKGVTRVMSNADSLGGGETAVAYMKGALKSSGFWDGRNAEGRRVGGQFHVYEYHLSRMQPAAELLIVGGDWMEWCEANKTALMAEFDARKAGGLK